METSFRYVREQLEIKGKEVERLHQLLDQSQQLLLNEQKKNQLLLESKAKPADWEKKRADLKVLFLSIAILTILLARKPVIIMNGH